MYPQIILSGGRGCSGGGVSRQRYAEHHLSWEHGQSRSSETHKMAAWEAMREKPQDRRVGMGRRQWEEKGSEKVQDHINNNARRGQGRAGRSLTQ